MPTALPEPLWELPDNPSLEWLKRRARNLRRRADVGNAAALDLIATYDPGGGAVTLSRAQRVVARAYGFAGWSKLREHLATIEEYARPMEPTSASDDRVEAFLRGSVLSYSEPGDAKGASRVLAEDPALAYASVWTLAACGRATALADLLDDEPQQVGSEGGPHRWVPLLYLCYARIPQQDAVGTLRTLLDHGADPNAGFLWKGLTSPFTALTGVLGGGEGGDSKHPHEPELVELLLDAGADPNDNQGFYNRAFEPDDSHLPPLLAHGAGHAHPSPWRDRLGTAYPSPSEMVGEHLRSAAEKGYAHRVRVLLEAGTDPNTRGYHPILGDATAYEVAVTHGWPECARLLAEAGARTDDVDPDDLALGRLMSGEAAPAPPGLPERRPDAMRLAAELHGVSALEALVAVGYDVSQPGRWGSTALHEAALRGDVDLCRWLLDHGADPTARDARFDSPPSGWARHAGHDHLAELLETPR